MKLFSSAVAAAALLCCATTVFAQTQTPPVPQTPLDFHGWDVLSVKPHNSSDNRMFYSSGSTANLRDANVPLSLLLGQAYGLRDDQISGLPAWAKSARWDVNAKIVDPEAAARQKQDRTTPNGDREFRAEILAILTDRFHLKAHTEQKIGPIYELTIAKGGPHLTASTLKAGAGAFSFGDGVIDGTAMSTSQLAELLEDAVLRNVVDRTGLNGAYTIKIRWSRDDQPAGTAGSDAPPDLFTALRDQLGLKLVPSKGPVTTLVVDSLEMPAED